MRGIDIAELPCIIAQTYLALHFKKTGREIGSIPVNHDNGLLFHGNQWDLVVGNPAGSSLYTNNGLEDVLRNLERDLDLNGRDDASSEYNFSVQQAVRSCKVGGRICLVLPEGLFSNSQDEFLRKYVSKYCKVLAIVSLPRGVFKKGRSAKPGSSGGQTTSMKMSILFAEKFKPVVKGSGIAYSEEDSEYPVFLAHIEKHESTSSEVCEWLGPELDMVLAEWKSWLSGGRLSSLSQC